MIAKQEPAEALSNRDGMARMPPIICHSTVRHYMCSTQQALSPLPNVCTRHNPCNNWGPPPSNWVTFILLSYFVYITLHEKIFGEQKKKPPWLPSLPGRHRRHVRTYVHMRMHVRRQAHMNACTLWHAVDITTPGACSGSPQSTLCSDHSDCPQILISLDTPTSWCTYSTIMLGHPHMHLSVLYLTSTATFNLCILKSGLTPQFARSGERMYGQVVYTWSQPRVHVHLNTSVWAYFELACVTIVNSNHTTCGHNLPDYPLTWLLCSGVYPYIGSHQCAFISCVAIDIGATVL